MEEAIAKIGLPVKCHICKIGAYIKPRTDYGGWFKLKSLNRILWYCPEHAGGGQARSTPPLGSTASDSNGDDDLTELLMTI